MKEQKKLEFLRERFREIAELAFSSAQFYNIPEDPDQKKIVLQKIQKDLHQGEAYAMAAQIVSAMIEAGKEVI